MEGQTSLSQNFYVLTKFAAPIKIKDERGNLLEEAELLPLEIKDDVRRGKISKENALAVQGILNKIIHPVSEEINGEEYVKMVSPEKFSRTEILKLHLAVNKKLAIQQARPEGIDVVKRKLFEDCFNELIRQETIHCAERGLLLLRIRNEMNMTIAAFYALYESGRNYGIKAAVKAEKDDNDANEKEYILKECDFFKDQIKSMEEAIETSAERHGWAMDLEEKRHKREMAFYNQLHSQLLAQLEGVIAKKSNI